MKTYFGHALPALAICLAAGAAHAQSESVRAPAQMAQAQQTTIYRTTIRERIVTRPAKHASASSRRVVSRTIVPRAPRAVTRTTVRTITRPVVRERVVAAPAATVVAPAASVVAPAPLALSPYQRSTLYRAIVEEPMQPATVVTRRFDPLPLTPDTVGAAIVESAEPAEAEVAIPAPAPILRQTVVIGQRVPGATPLYALPQTALAAEPELAPYRYALVDDQVMLVDPATGIVVASLTE